MCYTWSTITIYAEYGFFFLLLKFVVVVLLYRFLLSLFTSECFQIEIDHGTCDIKLKLDLNYIALSKLGHFYSQKNPNLKDIYVSVLAKSKVSATRQL